MSETKKEIQLINRKREATREKEDEDKSKEEELKSSKKKIKKSDKKKHHSNLKSEDEESSSSSSSDDQPHQTLFSGNEKLFSEGGLFGNLDNPQEKKTLFDQKDISIFKENSGSGSLFGNISNKDGNFLSGSLFDFQNINNKKEEKEEEEDEGGDDQVGNSPRHEYNPETENKECSDGYIRRFSKKLESLYIYDKLKKTFVSKGDGFLMIETHEKEEKDKKERYARIVYRNMIGGIIFQGVLNDQINKIVVSEKKLRHICLIVFLMNNEENKNLSLAQCKIPFDKKEDAENFSELYKNTIKYLKNEISDF